MRFYMKGTPSRKEQQLICWSFMGAMCKSESRPVV